jgi:hypothetical protein
VATVAAGADAGTRVGSTAELRLPEPAGVRLCASRRSASYAPLSLANCLFNLEHQKLKQQQRRRQRQRRRRQQHNKSNSRNKSQERPRCRVGHTSNATLWSRRPCRSQSRVITTNSPTRRSQREQTYARVVLCFQRVQLVLHSALSLLDCEREALSVYRYESRGPRRC